MRDEILVSGTVRDLYLRDSESISESSLLLSRW
jgi:hypothetical protein